MKAALSRRRFIKITAAAAGLSLMQGSGAQAQAAVVTWRGHAMGALASLQIHHYDQSEAARLVERAVREVRRLEGVFSLYRDDSTLSALNRHGILVAPPTDFVTVLAESRRFNDLTDGAFDPTVQVLWTLYSDHFSKLDADPHGPPESALLAALKRVGFDEVVFDTDRVVFARRGMALTLNGIAQGYATDRIVDMLRMAGIEHSLVDMGEPRAIGPHPLGTPWHVGIADPDQPDRVGDVVEVVDRAVATSAGSGFQFDPEGRSNHLFDPRTGRSGNLYKRVTVVMPTATAADALSTAFSLMPADAIAAALRAVHGQAHIVMASGEHLVLGL